MLRNAAYEELLTQLLQQGTPVTSKELASSLGVSVRTIKSYVSAINAAAPSQVIFSSSSGYHADRRLAVEMLKDLDTDAIPQSYGDRSMLILRRLTVENQASLNIFDLCEEFFVSYSTMKNDITKMNHEYEHLGVGLSIKGGDLVLVGSERDKRKLISKIIFGESSKSLVDLSILKKSFPPAAVDKVARLVRESFSEAGYYLNDFSYMNLVLHLLILVTRIESGKSVSDSYATASARGEENRVGSDLCDSLESAFDIALGADERRNVCELVDANAYFITTSSYETLRHNAGDEAVNLALQAIESVRDAYAIDLNSENFLISFTMHLKGLLQRTGKMAAAPNPMLGTLKRECPLTFDVATYIAIVLRPHTSAVLNDDEIAYIALHVGAEIERQKVNPDTISCTLVCPRYHGMAEDLCNKLLINFGNRISISDVFSFESEIDDASTDLVLSTIGLNNVHACRTIAINPMRWEKSRSLISSALDQIQTERKTKVLRESFGRFFDKRCFHLLAPTEETERDRVLDRLCDSLERAGYVTGEFRYGVKRREEMSSTAFDQIAIPHSVQTDAIESCIAIAIAPGGIQWGPDTVNVVLLVAMSGIDTDAFRVVYEAIVSLFDDKEILRLACEIKTFEEFKRLVRYRTVVA